jgi:hypothetical protein
MTKLSSNFEIPSDTMPEAFGINKERSKELSTIMRDACKTAAKIHGKADDTTLDHVVADVMREIDSKTKLEENERDLMMLQLGANLGFLRNVVGEIRGHREMRTVMENLSDEEKVMLKKHYEKMQVLGGRLAETIASVFREDDSDPSDHNFSDN